MSRITKANLKASLKVLNDQLSSMNSKHSYGYESDLSGYTFFKVENNDISSYSVVSGGNTINQLYWQIHAINHVLDQSLRHCVQA